MFNRDAEHTAPEALTDTQLDLVIGGRATPIGSIGPIPPISPIGPVVPVLGPVIGPVHIKMPVV